MNKSNLNLVAFLDSAQRTIIGEKVNDTSATTITIKNPIVVNIVPQFDPHGNPKGMALQMLPVFFKEFQADKKSAVLYTYQKNSITPIAFDGDGTTPTFDFKVYIQYEALFNTVPVEAPAPTTTSPESSAVITPINIFEEAETK